MPVWKEAVTDELSPYMEVEPAGGGRSNISMKMEFIKPIRAWNRFALEMTYGIAAAVGIQAVWLMFIFLKKPEKEKTRRCFA